MIKNQKGSALIALIVILACISTFIIVEYVYEGEDIDNFYSEVEVENRKMNEQSA